MNKELLRENRTHGDPMFPFGIYPMNRISSQDHLDYHWHEELEFLYVTEGCADFQINTVNYKVSRGEALFINSGIIHAGYTQDEPGCTFCAVVFSPRLLLGSSYDALQEKFLDPVINGRVVLPVHIRGLTEWEQDVLRHVRAVIDAGLSKEFTYELVIKAHLYLAFSLLLSNNPLEAPEKKPAASTYKTDKLKEVLKYIQEHYSRKLSIRELSALLNMSEAHFCRFFRQMLRKTPVDYINYYRINMAARLLGDSSKKIIEVAMDVGFDNCSYFINLFKGYMKCTPSEYRKLNYGSREEQAGA